MSSLQAARQDWAAEVRSRTVRATISCAVGGYHGPGGVLRLVDAPAARILRVISFEQLWRGAAANNGRARSRARSEGRANAAKKQPGTASDNSEVFWPKPRISALEGDVPAVIFAANNSG